MYLQGGNSMFKLFQRNSANSIDVNDIDEIMDNINLIDIREPYEYKGGHYQIQRISR